ncbi:MAG: heat-inducible transcription repressor HrcA [Clostridia bacterium]|nr:heat-inducible transcription repressor HrcA [Clostridia bacterium]
MELSPRKQKILAAVVEQYIKTGEPVGSKFLQSALDISVSSATIRNEMAELAGMGLLDQPHTSAGRVPTTEGYRYYVDHLMGDRKLDDSLKRRIEAGVSIKNASPEGVISKAGEFLAELTNCATVSTIMSGKDARVKRVEFVPIGSRTGMIVLLTSNGIIKSRVCRSDTDLNSSLLEKFYNIVKSAFIGLPLDEIDAATVQTVVASAGSDALAMIPFVTTLSDLIIESERTSVMLEGQSNILHHDSDYGHTAHELLDFLRRDEPLSRILAESRDGVDVRIGSENKFKQLEKSSVIMAKYNVDGDKRGSIGIIGPTRIDYAELIPSVRYLSDLVGKIITRILNEE